MGSTATLSIRIEQDIKDRLEIAAKSQNRSKAYLANEAIKEYLAVQDWQEQRIVEAISAAERGEGIPHREVLDWINTWGHEDEKPMPQQ